MIVSDTLITHTNELVEQIIRSICTNGSDRKQELLLNKDFVASRFDKVNTFINQIGTQTVDSTCHDFVRNRLETDKKIRFHLKQEQIQQSKQTNKNETVCSNLCDLNLIKKVEFEFFVM